jgi:hypothetical protein
VVADEVRTLAWRAAEAARNTAGMIKDTVGKVKVGSAMVQKTNAAFLQVTQSVQQATALIGDIAGASREQAQEIVQISSAVVFMGQVVQQAAGNAEEPASLSVEMKHPGPNPAGGGGQVGGAGERPGRTGRLQGAGNAGPFRRCLPRHRPGPLKIAPRTDDPAGGGRIQGALKEFREHSLLGRPGARTVGPQGRPAHQSNVARPRSGWVNGAHQPSSER